MGISCRESWMSIQGDRKVIKLRYEDRHWVQHVGCLCKTPTSQVRGRV